MAQAFVEAADVPWLVYVEQTKLRGAAHLEEELSKVESLGGEGLMIHRPQSSYEFGRRSSNLLKVKKFFEAEAKAR